MKTHGGKIKILVTFGILFFAVAVLLLMIFFAGKKTYTVTFDLNGGTLISGSITQSVPRGQDATPPTVVKDGSYLRAWKGTYQRVTKDVTVKAIWEYETTPGITYAASSNQNFVEIEGAYPYIRGDVYLGAYYGEKKVMGIKDGAFAEHAGITRVYMLDGLLSIGSEAFASCSALTEMDIPRTVVNLGEGAFRDCTSLVRIGLGDGLTVIEKETFAGCTSLTEIVIPEGVTHIGESAFEGCTSLERVVFPNTLVSIAESAFENCKSLVEIDIPPSVTDIGAGAFRGCRSLVNVVLHEGLLTIGDNAFRACIKLTAIAVPESVVSVGENAFAFNKLTIVDRPIYRPIDPPILDTDIEKESESAIGDASKEENAEPELETLPPGIRPPSVILPPFEDD